MSQRHDLPAAPAAGRIGSRLPAGALAGTLAFVITLGLGLGFARVRERELQTELRTHVTHRLDAIQAGFSRRASRLEDILDALATFASQPRDDARLATDFRLLAQGLLTRDRLIRALQIFPQKGGQLTEPAAGNEAVQGITFAQLLEDPRPEVRAVVREAIERRTATLSRPLDLRQGGRGIIARQPIFREGKLWGMATLVLDVGAVVDPASLVSMVEDLRLTLRTASGDRLLGAEDLPDEDPVLTTASIFGQTWTFAAIPTLGWQRTIAPQLRWLQASAALFALMAAVTAVLIARRHASLRHAVAARTRELATQEAEARRLSAEARAARDESEAARLRITEILTRISDGFALLDRDGRCIFANSRLAEYAGRAPEEFVGRVIWDFFPEVVGTTIHHAYQQAMVEQRPLDLEHFYPKFNRWFQHRLFPSPNGLTVVSRDITARKAAEDERRANEQTFREFVTRAPLPLAFAEKQGRVRFINDQFTRLFGYTIEDLPDITAWWQRAFPDAADRERSRNRWHELQRAGGEGGAAYTTHEFTVTCRDGSVRRVEVGGTALHDGYLAAFYDITARHRAEESAAAAQAAAERLLQLAERSRRALLSVVEDERRARVASLLSEERYRSFVETSFDWIWEVDTGWRFTFVSPKSRELLGYEPAELIGKTPLHLIARDQRKAIRAHLRPLVGTRRPVVELESRVLHRDGRSVLVETNCVPFFSPEGTWLGYRGINRDITARRAAERTLRLHSTALEAAANAIVITDRSGRIEWANRAFTSLSGWTLAEAAGRQPGELVKSGHHGPEFFSQMWKTLLAGGVWSGEIVNRRKDGTQRTEHMTITPVRDAQGEITHFVAIKQDITDRKILEQQFLQAQRVEAIGTLAGGIAHDLNNILAPMLMISGLIKQRLNQEDRELLTMVEANCRRGAEIVKQLLAFSRGQAGERIAVQPRHLIKEMLQIMRETFPREISLQPHISHDLPTVNADPTQLHQVLLNLCVNARDAMPRGGTLTVSAAGIVLPENSPILPPRTRPGMFVVVEVRDTGSGIAPEIRHRIFDPFFTTKDVGKGTGLGLPTVLGIVKSHGGFITVDSVPGHGATFKVYLPATPGGGSPAESDGTALPPPLARGQGETILVVDDEAAIRDSTRALLEAGNYRVLTAAQGEEALALFVEHRPQITLVLTDLMMPVMNGLVLIRALRQLAPELRIIATTGLDESTDERELRDLQVEHVVLKPYEPADLFERIATLLRGA